MGNGASWLSTVTMVSTIQPSAVIKMVDDLSPDSFRKEFKHYLLASRLKDKPVEGEAATQRKETGNQYSHTKMSDFCVKHGRSSKT